jgi:predicted nucleotidyltransferase
MPVLEGYFVVTKDDHVFEVKGTMHPSNRIVAYLRYAPSDEGDRIGRSGIRYRKIYDLGEREVYLADTHPEYLWKDEVHGRVLQSVPEDSVAYYLNPVDYLNELRDRGSHLAPLQEASLELASSLVQHANLDWSDIGVTGSQLLGLDTEVSDIDLVAYGESACWRLYSFLTDHADVISGVEHYEGERLDRHVDFRWGKNNPFWDVMRTLESKKVLQGLFRSYDFFIRLVKRAHENDNGYGNLFFQQERVHEVQCRILDDKDRIFTPAVYLVECSDCPSLSRLVSHRGRFTEHVRSGMAVKARGKIQSVTDSSSGKTELWLFLGERSTDYLIPL